MLVRYDGVGDTVALAPLIAALHHAGHELGLVASRATVDIFRPDIIRSHMVNDLGDPHSVLPDILARDYDVAFIATEKPYAYTLAKKAGIARRIGFWNGFGKPFKSLWVRSLCSDVRFRSVGDGTVHEVEVLFRLGSGFHKEISPTRDLDRLRELFFRVAPPRPLSFAVQVTQKWLSYGDVDAVARLLLELSARRSLHLIGAASEETFLAAIEQGCDLRIERHATAATWIERIASSRMLLTPDTGAAHVAGMVGTKVIDCFPAGTRAGVQQRWRPWATPAVLCTMDAFHRHGTLATIQEACAQLNENEVGEV